MTPAPFVQRDAELWYCQECQAWAWTDLEHECRPGSGERWLLLILTALLLFWLLVILGIVKWSRT